MINRMESQYLQVSLEPPKAEEHEQAIMDNLYEIIIIRILLVKNWIL